MGVVTSVDQSIPRGGSDTG